MWGYRFQWLRLGIWGRTKEIKFSRVVQEAVGVVETPWEWGGAIGTWIFSAVPANVINPKSFNPAPESYTLNPKP